MKLFNEDKVVDQIQIGEEKKYELTLIGLIVPHVNHKLFEIDPKTRAVKEVDYYYEETIDFDPKWKQGQPLKIKKKVIVEEGKIYISALNTKNALKHFDKGSNGSKFSINDDYLKL